MLALLSTHVRIWKPQLILKQSNFLYLDKPVFLSRLYSFLLGVFVCSSVLVVVLSLFMFVRVHVCLIVFRVV